MADNEQTAAAQTGGDEAAPSGPVVDTLESIELEMRHLLSDYLPDWVLSVALPALQILLILLIAYLASSWLDRIIRSACRRANVEETLSLFFGKLGKWTVFVVTIISCLSIFGVETTSFAAVLASAGVAIGLALQGTLQNFSAGVMLLIFRPFKIDDYVEAAGEEGTIKEIDLFVTHIDTLDNRRVIIPNASIFGSVIKNYTHNEVRRVDVVVGVHYDNDIDKTKEVLLEAARSVKNQSPTHPPEIYLTELGSSSVDYQVRIWAEPQHYWQIREDATRASKYYLEEAGLTIPFPQLDVHFDPGVQITAQNPA